MPVPLYLSGVVEIFAFLELEQKLPFFKGLESSEAVYHR